MCAAFSWGRGHLHGKELSRDAEEMLNAGDRRGSTEMCDGWLENFSLSSERTCSVSRLIH